MQDSLPEQLKGRAGVLIWQQVHSLFWICVAFPAQDGFGFIGLAGPLKILF